MRRHLDRCPAARASVDSFGGWCGDGRSRALPHVHRPRQPVAAGQSAGGVDQHGLEVAVGMARQSDLGRALLVQRRDARAPVALLDADPAASGNALAGEIGGDGFVARHAVRISLLGSTGKLRATRVPVDGGRNGERSVTALETPRPCATSWAHLPCSAGSRPPIQRKRRDARTFRFSDHQPLAGTTSRPAAALFLPDAERREGVDRAGGARPALRGAHRLDHEGREPPAGVQVAQPQRQDSGDHRSRRAGRSADRPVRVRRHPALPLRQDGEAHPGRPDRPLRDDSVGVLPDRRRRPDVRPARLLLQVRRQGHRGQAPAGALRQRDEAADAGDRRTARGPAVDHGRPLHDRRHRDLPMGARRQGVLRGRRDARHGQDDRISAAGSTNASPGRPARRDCRSRRANRAVPLSRRTAWPARLPAASARPDRR